MNTLILSITCAIILFIIFRCLKDRSIRKFASYKLYAVRDDLVCLVAEGKLEEDSKIFQYYYKRVNHILKLAPNIGIDDAMDAFISFKKTASFEKSLMEANKNADEMLSFMKKHKIEEDVRTVVANYYAATRFMILAHSSLLRIFYILLIKLPIVGVLKKILPTNTTHIIKVVDFTHDEEAKFRSCTL